MKGLTKTQQKNIVARIQEKGMTVPGWARVNKFATSTVMVVLYGEYGRSKLLTPMAEKIVRTLKEGGFHVAKS